MNETCKDLSKGKLIIYTNEEGINSIEIIQQENNLWLSAEKIADLFGKDRTNIQRHIKNIFNKKELNKDTTCAFFAQVQKEGTRHVKRQIPYYNLDMIISSVLNQGHKMGNI